MLYNYSLREEEQTLQHVPYSVVPPACLPSFLPAGRVWLKAANCQPQPLLKSALVEGIFLTVGQLHAIRRSLKLPDLKNGSGKRGSVIKIDLARQLVSHVCADFTPKEQKKIVSQVMGQAAKKTADEKEILEYVKNLDVENQDAFKQMTRLAADRLQERTRAEGVAEFLEKRKKTFRVRFALRRQLGQSGAKQRKKAKQARKPNQAAPAPSPPDPQPAGCPQPAESPHADDPLPAGSHLDLAEDRPQPSEGPQPAEDPQPPEGPQPAECPEPHRREEGERGPKRSGVTPTEFKHLFPSEAVNTMQYFSDKEKQVFRVSYPGSILDQYPSTSCLVSCWGWLWKP